MTQPANTPGYDTCGATKRAGGPCTRPAGWGTDHPGIGTCKLHLGSTKGHTTAARVEQARRDVELFAARRDIDPGEALLELVQWTAGEVDYWRQEVRLLERDELTWGVTKVKEGGDDRGTTEEAKPHIVYVMLTAASDRLKEYAVAALRAGVDERRVRIAENQGRLFEAGLRMIFAGLELDERQLELLPVLVPRVMREIAAGGVS